MRPFLVALFVILAGAANASAADIGLVSKPPLSDDPVQCHWSFSISVLAIASACKPVEHAKAVAALAEINGRLSEYMAAMSGLDAAELARQSEAIRAETLARIGVAAGGQCTPDDWAKRVYPFDMEMAAADFSSAFAAIDSLLAGDPPVTQAPCD